MMNKGFIFFSTLNLLFFFLCILLSSILYGVGLILIFFIIVIQGLGFIIFNNTEKKPLWDPSILKKSIIAHCDGIIESIEIVENYKSFKNNYYKIVINNQIPQCPTRIAPIQGNFTFTNFIKENNKNKYDIEGIISNDLTHVIITDKSIEKNGGIINIIDNKYLLNDITELLCFDKTVNYNTPIWSMYIASTSTIFILESQWDIKVVPHQNLIHGETILATLSKKKIN